MTTLAADEKQGSRRFRVGGMVALASLYLGLYVLLTNATIWHAWQQPAQVLLYTVVTWHFMLDAGLWRLSRPFQRAAARDSFPFLFARA